MLAHFEILLNYSIFLIEKCDSIGVFQFYNYMFEQYFPENVPNLNKIDYEDIFVGKYSKKSIDVYKKLLDLWILLQEKETFEDEELLWLQRIRGEVLELLKNFS